MGSPCSPKNYGFDPFDTAAFDAIIMKLKTHFLMLQNALSNTSGMRMGQLKKFGFYRKGKKFGKIRLFYTILKKIGKIRENN